MSAVPRGEEAGGAVRERTYVYIAGPYGDKDPYCVIDARINESRRAARELALRGIPYYSPHMNCAHFEVIAPEAPVEFWIATGMVFLEHAWGIWLLPGWEDSKGTALELTRAHQMGIRHVFSPEMAVEAIASTWEHDRPRVGTR